MTQHHYSFNWVSSIPTSIKLILHHCHACLFLLRKSKMSSSHQHIHVNKNVQEKNIAWGALNTQKLSFMASCFLRTSRPMLPVMPSQSSLKLHSCREHGHCQGGASKQGHEEVCTVSQQTHTCYWMHQRGISGRNLPLLRLKNCLQALLVYVLHCIIVIVNFWVHEKKGFFSS